MTAGGKTQANKDQHMGNIKKKMLKTNSSKSQETYSAVLQHGGGESDRTDAIKRH